MSEMIVKRESLQSVADKIKAKAGTTGDLVFPEGFENAVDSISGGDTTNEDGLITGAQGQYSNPRVKTVRNYAFYYYSRLESANLPLVTDIGNHAFYKCMWLKTVNFPLVTNIDNYAFSNCSALASINFPLVTKIGTHSIEKCSALASINFPLVTNIDGYAFSGCSKLTSVDLPLATNIGSYAFNDCSKLTSVDLPLVTTLPSYAFSGCSKFTALILRSEMMCTLPNTNTFLNCYRFHGTVNAAHNPEGLQDGYIYVPSALIEDYKVATNWSDLATQFRALEDYTVDGTTTGELDETKIGA